MTNTRPDRKPVQMSLFEQRKVSVSWVAKKLGIGRDNVIRLIQSGSLRGYRHSPKGWWYVIETSVFEHEKKVIQEYVPDASQGSAK